MQCKQRTQLVLSRTESFFRDLASNANSHVLLTHFSHLPEVFVQHAPDISKYPSFWKVTSRNGVRSYFDIVSAQFIRRDILIQSAVYFPGAAFSDKAATVQQPREEVVVRACTNWAWRASSETFTEDQTCTLQFDETGQVVSFVISTQGTPESCVMLAMDKKSSDYRLK